MDQVLGNSSSSRTGHKQSPTNRASSHASWTSRTGIILTLRFVVMGVLALTATAQTLRIYHIDVEQAASTLLVSPGGKTLLIDSGNIDHGSRIKAVMDDAKVSRIDYLVTT